MFTATTTSGEAGGQRSEAGGQRSEAGGQRSEAVGQRSEAVGRRRDAVGQQREAGGQQREAGGQQREAEGQQRTAERGLDALIARLRGEVLAELPDARVEGDLVTLGRAIEALELERLRRVAECAQRGAYARDGHLSMASWLAERCRTTWGSARGQVGLARALAHMPAAHRALERGAIGMGALQTLAGARGANPAAYARDEPALVDAALQHPAGVLSRLVAQWSVQVAADPAFDEPEGEGERARRRLHASVTFGGWVRLDGDLDPEGGQVVLAALGSVLGAEARRLDPDHGRSPAQRRADALEQVCRGWLDRADRPTVAGERPHLNVVLHADALQNDTTRPERPHAVASFEDTGPVPSSALRRLACDAAITRVVLGPRSEPLDVGRRSAVVPPAMRRAVAVRDGGCRFPGCDRPPSWCDAHHVVHWADGGPTSVGNLVLLCRRHHRLVHDRGGFSLAIERGSPVFRRPDGAVLGSSGLGEPASARAGPVAIGR